MHFWLGLKVNIYNDNGWGIQYKVLPTEGPMFKGVDMCGIDTAHRLEHSVIIVSVVGDKGCIVGEIDGTEE